MSNALAQDRMDVGVKAEPGLPDPAVRVIDEVRRRYGIREEAEVAAFLVRYPDVVGLLAETRAQIGEYFGADPVELDILVDPEAPAEPELYALIRTPLASDEALRRLRRFDEAWWLDALDRTRAPIVVSIEHV